jgi:ketosteroid isomerase-like protein
MDETANALDAVRSAVGAYDTALRADDLDAVGAWFDDAPATTRFGERGAVRGASEIDAMRRQQPRGLARDRVDGRADFWLLAPGAAVATLEFTRPDGSQGLRTQVWRATEQGWRISHAHLSILA